MEHRAGAPDGPPKGGSSSFPPSVAAVLPWLERSRAYGFLGPGPVQPHVTHARGFAAAVGEPVGSFVDLGSGGGVPGLVLAALWPESEAVLLDSNERRTGFLADALAGLGWEGRVRVVRSRAEEAGRDQTLRGRYPLVVSRSFGPPPVTAECAAPLLAVGGRLVVSEPPEGVAPSEERWPPSGLATVGMAVGERVGGARGSYQVLRQVSLCPEAYPRRVGVPGKRPLW